MLCGDTAISTGRKTVVVPATVWGVFVFPQNGVAFWLKLPWLQNLVLIWLTSTTAPEQVEPVDISLAFSTCPAARLAVAGNTLLHCPFGTLVMPSRLATQGVFPWHIAGNGSPATG